MLAIQGSLAMARRAILRQASAAALLVAAIGGAAATPAAAATDQRSIPARLAGTTWRAVTIAGRPVRPITDVNFFGDPVTVNPKPTLTFQVDEFGMVPVGAGCNSHAAFLSIVGHQIRISIVASTLMACLPKVMDQERRFIAALRSAKRFTFDGPFLVLHPSGRGAPTRFVRVKAAERR